MCVIGNPPYSGESANKGDHIMALMEAYKNEPGGKERLRERNPKWINDDYVKFIRMAEDLIAGFDGLERYGKRPAFDLRQIEDAIDQVQQMLRR